MNRRNDTFSFAVLGFVSTREAQQLTGYSVRWLRELISEKRVDTVLVSGRRFWLRDSLLNYKNSTKSRGGRPVGS